MSAELFFILIDRSTRRADELTRCLPANCRVQRLDSATIAAARLRGGGVAGVLFEISCSAEAVPVLRAADPGIPLLVLADPDSSIPANLHGHAGLHVVITEGNWVPSLPARVREQQPSPTGRRAKVVAFSGAKGGCGTTTVALSVAHQLAEHSDVILAEVESRYGGLRQYLNPSRIVNSGLWQSRTAARLRISFGTQNAKALIDYASQADYVVLDLPPNSCQLASADVALIVAERERICCAAAAATIEELSQHATARQLAVVLVNKFPFAAPLPISDIERQLGLDILAVIPPAADLYAAASRQHQPVSAYDPSSSAGRALAALAQAVSSSATAGSPLRP